MLSLIGLIKSGGKVSFSRTHKIHHTYSHLKNKQESFFFFNWANIQKNPVFKPQEFVPCLNQKYQVACFSLSILTECNQNTLSLEKHLICGILLFKKLQIAFPFLWYNPVNAIGENKEVKSILDYFKE